VTQLYAFHYVPNPPLTSTNGWSIYSAKEEFIRMGVGTRTKAWRFTDINKDYTVRISSFSDPVLLICDLQLT
jgi:myotubularin-related protein 6/7/8